MAQRMVDRIYLEDLGALSTSNPEALAPAPDTLYYVIESRVLRNNMKSFSLPFFPVQSLVEARNLISRFYPRARSLMAESGSPEVALITWKEHLGEEVIIRIVKEHNPAVVATSPDTP